MYTETVLPLLHLAPQVRGFSKSTLSEVDDAGDDVQQGQGVPRFRRPQRLGSVI